MNLTEYDQTIIYEVARVSLSNPRIFEEICDELDIDDDHLKQIQNRLETYMETP